MQACRLRHEGGDVGPGHAGGTEDGTDGVALPHGMDPEHRPRGRLGRSLGLGGDRSGDGRHLALAAGERGAGDQGKEACDE